MGGEVTVEKKKKKAWSGTVQSQKISEEMRERFLEEAQSLRGSKHELENRTRDYYIHQQRTENEINSELNISKHQKSFHIANVRESVKDIMGEDVYDVTDNIIKSEEEEVRKTKLHHSKGTNLLQQGKKVMEMNLAGSGFGFWRKDASGYKGKGKEEGLEAQYGTRYTLGSKKLKYLFKKVTDKQGHVVNDTENQEQDINSKVRYNIGGPGALNSGDYKISNARNYVTELGQDYLEKVFASWQYRPENGEDVHLLIKGHSRGAVSAATGAMKLKAWIHSKYPELEHFVKFDLIQYDPVPGIDAYWGINTEIDHNDEREQFEVGGENYRALGSEAETTVIYSIHTNNQYFFTPQAVKGAKRVILTAHEHSAGLGVVDESQKRIGKERSHGEAFTDSKTGEVFRGSGISELEAGLYIRDENSVLIRMQTESQARSVVEKILKKTKKQKARHDVIYQVIAAWFQAEEEKKKPKEERFQYFNKNKKMSRKEMNKRKKQYNRKLALSKKAGSMLNLPELQENMYAENSGQRIEQYRQLVDKFLVADLSRVTLKSDKDICEKYNSIQFLIREGSTLNDILDQAKEELQLSSQEETELRVKAETCLLIGDYMKLKLKIMSSPYYALLGREEINRLIDDADTDKMMENLDISDEYKQNSKLIEHCSNVLMLKKLGFHLKNGSGRLLSEVINKRTA